MTTVLATRHDETGISAQRTASDVVHVTKLVQEVMRDTMQNGQHYGVIPGCGDKPTLLKPGAEKLCMTFRLAAMPEIQLTDIGGGHREYRVLTKLVHIPTGDVWGVGVGVCSTMESKYRWRGGARKCPKCGKEAIIKGKAEYGGGWLCFGKKGGCGAKWPDGAKEIEGQQTDKVENPDIADQYNTVLKMAKKRSLVDATLTATAASDIFTQDLEELADRAPVPVEEPTAPLPDESPASPADQTGDEADRLLAQILDCFVALDEKKWQAKTIKEVRQALAVRAKTAGKKLDAGYLTGVLTEAKSKLSQLDSRSQ